MPRIGRTKHKLAFRCGEWKTVKPATKYEKATQVKACVSPTHTCRAVVRGVHMGGYYWNVVRGRKPIDAAFYTGRMTGTGFGYGTKELSKAKRSADHEVRQCVQNASGWKVRSLSGAKRKRRRK